MRQVSNQVPGGFLWQLFGIGGDHNRASLSLGSVWSHIHLQSPPRLLVAISESSHYLYPFSRALPIVPPFASGHHRAKRDALFDGLLHQLGSYLELGAELGIVLASLEVMGRGVGLEVNGPVDLLVCKQTAYAHHPAFCLADVCKPLPAHMSSLLAPLAVPVLVYYENALLARSTRTLFKHELQPTFVDLPWVPPRFREEPLQALRFFTLRSLEELGVGKSGQGLVAFGAGAEEVIEALGIVLKWAGSRAYGVAFGHGEAPPPPLEHDPPPYSTNYR